MGQKYIIDIPDDKVSDFVVMGSTHFFMPYMMAGHIGHHDTGLPIEPYIKPDFKLIKQKAHDNGYNEGFQDGYCKGMNDYLQKPEVKEESDRAYAHGYSDAESKFSEIRKEAYQEGLKDGQAVTVANEQNNAFNNGYKKCLEDMEQVRKEAYDKGYHDGHNVCYENAKDLMEERTNEAYQRGLDLAWEAARGVGHCKLWGDYTKDTGKTSVCAVDVLDYYSASEAIEKLKSHEQEQGEIKVWDEVKAFEKKPFIVTGFGYGDDEEDVYCYGFVTENGISTSAKKSSCVRTGRTFPEIAAVLEKMREGQEQ